MLARVVVAAAVGLGAYVLLGGCIGDACNDASSECVDGHTLRTCGGSVDAVGQTRHLSTQACPKDTPYCVTRESSSDLTPFEVATRATCAPSAKPAAECAGVESGTICNEGRVDRCDGGYLFPGVACSGQCLASTAAGTACAVCAVGDSTADPLCTPNARSVCGGSAIYRCACGFRLEPQTACASDQACVSAALGPNIDTFCAVGVAPDPGCKGPQTDATYCDGDTTLVRCHLGYAIERVTCASGCDSRLAICHY